MHPLLWALTLIIYIRCAIGFILLNVLTLNRIVKPSGWIFNIIDENYNSKPVMTGNTRNYGNSTDKTTSITALLAGFGSIQQTPSVQAISVTNTLSCRFLCHC